MGAFSKMHGLGNDFVVIDARREPVAMTNARARAIADRREGIGCDQLILIEASDVADARMRIFNADGSEVEACGNASRAVALLLGGTQRIETAGGLITLTADNANRATVGMGAPVSEWDAVPLAYAMDTAHLPLAWDDVADGAAINVGNPHIVFFVPDCDAVRLDVLGPVIEHDPLFPQRINVNVATVTGPSSLKLRVWERGAGLTRACGTGACATAAVALARKLVRGPVAVDLPGGRLIITQAENGALLMSGPATFVFAGEADWASFG
jgi:diaminopimelate epimerase